MRTLEPIILKDRYFEQIEKEINRLFYLVIYGPLSVTLQQKLKVENAEDTLTESVESGRVWYQDGKFYGSYNSLIAKRLIKIGAKFHPRSDSWSIPFDKVPPEVLFAQNRANERYDTLRRSILQTLDDMNIASIDDHNSFEDEYEHTIDWFEGDFQRTVKAITIAPKLTAFTRNLIATEYSTNLTRYVKDWAEENILKLRGEIQTNAFNGRRSTDMIAYIEKNYGVSKRKAKFLARQETSLLLSKFRESRYRDIGLNTYKWRTSHDERVREDHKHLDDKTIDWSDPPIVNRKTGMTAHAGEDFGCRCIAVPIIE